MSELDPILAYLLEFNKTMPIKYKGRHLIPPGGLKDMLASYKKFHLGKEECPKTTRDTVVGKEADSTLEELYKILD